MIKTKQKNAFSLIELSIVIIVIGILIAGVIQAQNLITKSTLSAARALTQSSPIAGIKDLTLWLDATKEGALTNTDGLDNVDDGDYIQSWSDQNPQVLDPVNFTTSTADTYPQYSIDGLNGLPSIVFDGDNTADQGDYLTTPHKPRFANRGAFTIFVVASLRNDILGSDDVIMTKQGDDATAPPWSMEFNNSTARVRGRVNHSTGQENIFSSAASVALKTPLLIMWNREPGTASSLYFNSNSTASVSGTADETMIDSSANLSIAKFSDAGIHVGRFGNLNISEIIMFSRSLKTSEREAIEDYLNKKWGLDS